MYFYFIVVTLEGTKFIIITKFGRSIKSRLIIYNT